MCVGVWVCVCQCVCVFLQLIPVNLNPRTNLELSGIIIIVNGLARGKVADRIHPLTQQGVRTAPGLVRFRRVAVDLEMWRRRIHVRRRIHAFAESLLICRAASASRMAARGLGFRV